MNKRKIVLIVSLLVLLFALTGCSSPTDANGNVKLIEDSTTFKYMFDNEGFFASLIVFPFAKAMNFFAKATNSATFAVILVTVVVNLIVLAFTWKSSIGQQKMMELQPEVKKIQKKYEGKTTQTAMQQQQIEIQALYKKHGVSMFGGFASMFIQFPIMIGIYHAVTRSYYVSKGSLLGLSLETKIGEGIFKQELGYILIFAIMMILQIISMKLPNYLQERKAKKEAELHFRRYQKPENPMGFMMIFMAGMIGVFSFTLPAAMSVYWATSSLVMVVKTLILNKVMEKGATTK